jgi:phage terminase large subunit-like protein
MAYVATKQAMRDIHAKWPRTSAMLIEDKANSAIVDELKRELPGLIAVEPEGGKLVRAWA